MAKIHYVYELVRTTPGAGATRYIGVRTAENVTPEKDEYWSSSERVAQQRAAGAKFTKKILKTFATREEAELYEAELHWQNMVGKNPHFYNVTSQLIEGKVDQFLPRERNRSPDGDHLWFKPGSEPDGLVHDPARWAQYRDLSHRDSLRQQAGFPQTYECRPALQVATSRPSSRAAQIAGSRSNMTERSTRNAITSNDSSVA
jgi:hypothetical protein